MSLQVVGFFCEDIREEKSGQTTLVGILPDNINVPPRPPDAPASLQPRMPKLGLYVRINLSPDEGVRAMRTKLKFPDGGEAEMGLIDEATVAKSLQDAIASNLPVAGLLQYAVLQGLAIPTPPGLITGVLEVDGTEHTIAILRFVHEAGPTSSNASAPPPSQSPTAP
jgi:hypothetical protein